MPKVTEHTFEDKKEFENGKATNDLDTNEPDGKRQDILKKKTSSDDAYGVYGTSAGSPSLSADEDDPNFIDATAEKESHGSSVDKTSTLVPGIDSKQVK